MSREASGYQNDKYLRQQFHRKAIPRRAANRQHNAVSDLEIILIVSLKGSRAQKPILATGR